MEVMYTANPGRGPGKYFMVVASEEEWEQVLADLVASDLGYASNASITLVGEMKGWGIEP